MIEEAMATHLKADAYFTALVGSELYPVRLEPDFKVPAVVYQRISTPARYRSHDGPSGLVTTRFQFTIYSNDYTESRNIVKAIRMSLDGFKGELGIPGHEVRVDSVEIEGPSDGWTFEHALFNPLLDALISHEEEV